jgi:hypothetical protein
MSSKLIFLLLFINTKGLSQDTIKDKYIAFLDNKNISFIIYNYGADLTESVKPKSYTTLETNFKDSAWVKYFKTLSSTEWISLLNDPEKDWAANLVLYQIYERDATVFKIIKGRNEWIGVLRQSDISYWKSFLSLR